jgi:hypothetical protein
MTDRARLEQALIAADKAGDTEAAKKLATALRGFKEPQPQQPVARDPNAPPALPGEAGYDADVRPLSDAYDSFGKDLSKYGNRVNAAFGELNSAHGSGFTGMADAAFALLRGAVASPVGAVVGAVRGDSKEEEASIADEFVRKYSSPFSQQGKAQLGVLGAIASPITESGTDVALAPLFAGGAPSLIGPAKIARNARNNRPGGHSVPGRPVAVDSAEVSGGQGIKPATAAKRTAGLEGVYKAAPTLEELKAQAADSYKRADEAGIIVSENSAKGLKTRIVSIAKKEGIDPDLHPDASAALNRIIKSEGDLTLSQVETLRKIASDAKGSLKPADSRIAAKIVDELDGYLDNLSESDVVAGTPQKAQALKEARAMYTRVKRSETIARLMDRAETKAGAHYTQAGMEHAIRGEFKTLALNDKELRRFSKAEQEAIKNIARGGKWENSLRNLGKFDPSSGGMASFMSTLLAGGGAIATGGASLALPAAAYLAKRKATKMASAKVAELDEMVRRGEPPSTTPRRNKLAEPQEF